MVGKMSIFKSYVQLQTFYNITIYIHLVIKINMWFSNDQKVYYF